MRGTAAARAGQAQRARAARHRPRSFTAWVAELTSAQPKWITRQAIGDEICGCTGFDLSFGCILELCAMCGLTYNPLRTPPPPAQTARWAADGGAGR